MHDLKPRLQLTLVPQIPPTPIPAPGDTITTHSGNATVTRLEPAGNEAIIFADYGNGTEQPHITDSLLPYPIGTEFHQDGKTWKLVRGNDTHGTLNRENSNQEVLSKRLTWKEIDRDFSRTVHTFSDGTRSIRTNNPMPGISHTIEFVPPAPEPQKPKPKRRHSPKGKATGWIEERQGNLKRKNPSTSYYYCWQEGDRRGKTYVPVRQMSQVWKMVDARYSVDEILQVIVKQPKPHHTDTPKI